MQFTVQLFLPCVRLHAGEPGPPESHLGVCSATVAPGDAMMKPPIIATSDAARMRFRFDMSYFLLAMVCTQRDRAWALVESMFDDFLKALQRGGV